MKSKTNPAPGLKTVDMDRKASGIPGFDELVYGGLIYNRAYLVLGPPGSGKTIFSVQFVYNGITQFREPGVIVTFEVTPEELRRDMSGLHMEIKPLEEDGKLIILDATSANVGLGSNEKYIIPRPVTIDSILYEIYNAVQKIGAKRVVIDSLDSMELESENPSEFRTHLLKLTAVLKSFGCTILLIAEGGRSRVGSRGRGVDEFVTDGTVRFYHVVENLKRVRKIEILKIRGSHHSDGLHPYEITDNGIIIKPVMSFAKLVKDVPKPTREKEESQS